MQTSNENIIYQLTNIGASQQISPHRTAKRNSEASPKDEHLTPLLPSKGKKWTEKLPKFQRNSDKRKKSFGSLSSSSTSPVVHPLTISSPITLQRTNPISPFTATDQIHASRTSSLPRPTSALYKTDACDISRTTAPSSHGVHLVKHTPPPRVLPFGYPKSSKKSFLNEVCTVCDEPISNRSNGERIVELECGHISHQECLLISFESSIDFDSNDFYTIFPQCNRCKDEEFKENRCVPKNHDLKDKLISEFLLTKKARHSESQGHTARTAPPPLIRFLSSPVMTMSHQSETKPFLPRTSTDHSFDFPLASAKARNEGVISRRGNKRKGYFSSRPYIERIAKGSSFVASSSIVSSVDDGDSILSLDYSQTSRGSKLLSDKSPLPLLRSFFIEKLLDSFKNEIVDWQVDATYGLLRLVDRLMVSKGGSVYSNCWCFLFEKAIIVASQSKETDSDKVLEGILDSFQIYGPISKVRVDTVEASIIKCTIQETESSVWQELFFTETLNTDSSKIIQKWISGLLDHDLIFNELNFTSTLPLPPTMRKFGNTNNKEGSSFASLVSPTKIVELATLDQASNSIIVKRGFHIPMEHNLKTNKTDTIETVMTTISSILSLKRDRPSDLVIVLQLEFEKMKQEESLTTIYNSLKALIIKYPSLKICVVNSNGYVLTYALAKQKYFKSNNLAELELKESELKFDPEKLKEALYPNGMIQNVGIAVLSNSSMEMGKSCLLMDFKCFTCSGRRRPNELKIKVGYLNVDYSDKINELVEVGSWDFFLEALSYSFSLDFGDDEDDDISDGEEEALDDEELEDNELNSFSDGESTTTIPVGSPLGEHSGSDTKSLIWEINAQHVNNPVSKSLENLQTPTYPALLSDCYTSKSPNTVEDVWDPLLNDIERAIQEIREFGSSTPTETTNRQPVLYNYL